MHIKLVQIYSFFYYILNFPKITNDFIFKTNKKIKKLSIMPLKQCLFFPANWQNHFPVVAIYAFCLNAFNLFYFVADNYSYSFWILFSFFIFKMLFKILFKNLFFLMVCKRKVGQLGMEECICHFEKWFSFIVFLKLWQNIVYSVQYLIKWLFYIILL